MRYDGERADWSEAGGLGGASAASGSPFLGSQGESKRLADLARADSLFRQLNFQLVVNIAHEDDYSDTSTAIPFDEALDLLSTKVAFYDFDFDDSQPAYLRGLCTEYCTTLNDLIPSFHELVSNK